MHNMSFGYLLFYLMLIGGFSSIMSPAEANTYYLDSTGTPESPAIANGDSVVLRGIATGHPHDGLQVWVISYNYLRIITISVNADNTFEFELRPADTQNLASGQYYVVVQHPMMNGQFDITYDTASGRVINRQMGANGMEIYTMSGSGSLQGPDSAQALVQAISSQNVDDMFTTYTFAINPPSASINAIPNHLTGDRFTISGTTNLAAGDSLMVEITSSSFRPTQKSSTGEFSGAGGMVTVIKGNGGYNHWSFDVDTASFKPDEYLVKVSGATIGITSTTTFTIVERLPETTSVPVTPVLSSSPVVATSPIVAVPSSTIPVKTPSSLGISLAALFLVSLKRAFR